MEKPVSIGNDLYLIRERLDLIEPRFRTTYVNLYLLLGDDVAALIDTGSGLKNPIEGAKDIIGDRDLLVFNTHSHFDHCGGNYFFDEVHIHKLDYIPISRPIDVSFLKESPGNIDSYAKLDFQLPICNSVVPLLGGENFDLGGRTLEVIFSPGHTPGSIVLASDRYLFTGDVVNYGAVFMPPLHSWKDYLDVLDTLFSRFSDFSIFPGHEEYGVNSEIFSELIDTLTSYRAEEATYDEFLDAMVTVFPSFTVVVEKSVSQ